MNRILLIFFITFSVLNSKDLTLIDAYQNMIKNEYSLESKKNKLDAKKEDINQAKSKLYPQIEGKISVKESKREINLYNRDEIERNKNYSLYISQAIYHPEHYSMIDKSKYSYDYETLIFHEHKQKLTLDLIEVYVNLLKIKNLISLKKEYLNLSKYKLSLYKRQFEIQTIDKVTYLESQIDYNDKNIEYQTELNNYKLYLNKLKNLVGLNTDLELIYSKSNDKNVFDDDFINKNVDEILKRNLQYLMSNININLAKNELKDSKYQYYPKVDLNLSYTNFDSNDDFVTDYENISTISIDVKVPIFNGGATSSLVRKNRLIVNSYENERKDLLNKIRIDFEQTNIKLQSHRDSFLLFKESLESSELYYISIQKSFDKGLKSIIDLSEAKTKLVETKYNFLENYYNYIYEYAKIKYFIGDLSEDVVSNISENI